MTPDQIRLAGIICLALAAAYFAALWLLKPGEKGGDETPLSKGPVGLQMTGGAQFHNHGSMSFSINDKPKPRLVAAGTPLPTGGALQGVTVILRPINATQERVDFAESLAGFVTQADAQAIVQTGHGGVVDFAGARICPAPNPAALAAADDLQHLFAQLGHEYERNDSRMISWGDAHNVLIEISGL